MRLYVLRHGLAGDHATWPGDDAERPLTEEGRAKTLTAAQGLARLGISLGGIASSPFVRAVETARITATALHLSVDIWPELAPGTNLAALAPRLAPCAESPGWMIVGHEPDLSALIGALIAGNYPARIMLKKGACGCVDVSTKAWRATAKRCDALAGRGALVWLMTAAQLGRVAGVSA